MPTYNAGNLEGRWTEFSDVLEQIIVPSHPETCSETILSNKTTKMKRKKEVNSGPKKKKVPLATKKVELLWYKVKEGDKTGHKEREGKD